MRNRLAGACWLLAAVSFLAANVLVGLAWDQPRFSWAEHNISDLGNVTCGVWDTSRPRPVCSPWHPAMNAVFVAAGLLLALGALLAHRALRPGRAAAVAVASIVAAGTGYVLAGLYPADVDENRHVLGALLVFALGNAALLAAALARRSPLLRELMPVSALLGLLGLAGTVLFLARVDVGIGVGGMERVAVFPLFAWVTTVGLRLLGFRRSRPLS
ncbi:DUF998 domain-containing protein [Micromonospora sp. C32]|uniref:DUF998 domain-containing protein n=1 Tax=unclassified Micromonospora TaxID=2617518 RepID=UPI001B39275F|nr:MULTISPECIES: DUF998 domain-containing protein [unclassified Micromonospora]MBQ1043006.1 DUF998 domain-containing protein [Micromonospora sp. C72]MBQ1056654.1 DUF998 domain-containing protein [Micromonospora sp. C32]